VPKNPFESNELPDELDVNKAESDAIQNREEVEQMLKELARLMHNALPAGWGFALYMIQYGGTEKDKDIYFASSIAKPDVVQFLREWTRSNELN
jgi:hypothetical protein